MAVIRNRVRFKEMQIGLVLSKSQRHGTRYTPMEPSKHNHPTLLWGNKHATSAILLKNQGI
jgi:hypothetical protein